MVPDQATANAIAIALQGGASFAAAAAPAGARRRGHLGWPADPRRNLPALAGDAVATPHSRPPAGSIVGPIQSRIGWHVVKIDSVRREGGKPLSAARSEIAAKLAADKRKDALEDLVDPRPGRASTKAATSPKLRPQAKLTVTETPLITANGTARDNPPFACRPSSPRRFRTGFELTPGR